jgi:DNA (cytosine-5)-methyltransferase 1
MSTARTVDTRFGDHRLFLHPIENRGFTVREAARIQGFRDDFVFSGTLAQQYRMIGNAVPPPVGRSVAELVRHLL